MVYNQKNIFLLKYLLLLILIQNVLLRHKNDDSKEHLYSDKENTYENIKDLKKDRGLLKKNQGFYKLKLGLEKNEKIISYVDANSDKFTDFITYTTNTSSINFYINYYSSKKGSFFKTSTDPIISIDNSEKIYTVANVYSGLLNKKGSLAFIISLKNNNNGQKDNYIYTKQNESSPYQLLYQLNDTNIIIADIDGDRVTEIIYYGEDGLRKVIKFESDKLSDFNEENAIKEFKDYLILGDEDQNCLKGTLFLDVPISDNLGNAFIDIDADCKNDILISSIARVNMGTNEEDESYYRVLEVYEGTIIHKNKSATKKYCLRHFIKLENLGTSTESKYGPFSLADFNDDGFVDIIFPKIDTNKVAVLFNTRLVKSKWSNNYCENSNWANPKNKESFSKSKYSYPVFNISNYLDGLSEDYIPKEKKDQANFGGIYTLNRELKDGEETLPSSKFYTNPKYSNTTIRIGDFKSEAFAGMITLMEENGKTYMRLFKNYFGTLLESKSSKYKAFVFSVEYEVTNPLYAAFFDLDENGQLDLLIISDNNEDYSNNDTDKDSDSIAFYGSFFFDAYFVKADTFLVNNKLYSTEIGTNYRFIATENDGSRRMDTAFQLVQCTDLNLNLPYALVGIGRSNNYIEYFNVISNSLDYFLNETIKKNFDNNTFSPIIPNTQMLIKKTVSYNKKNKAKNIIWNVNLFVNPANNLWILAIVIGAVLIVILIAIIILQIKENNEDKKQEENFSAWFA